MTSVRDILAYNLKENRRKCGLSQAKLAEKANITTQYIAMMEFKTVSGNERKIQRSQRKSRKRALVDRPSLFSQNSSQQTFRLNKGQRFQIIQSHLGIFQAHRENSLLNSRRLKMKKPGFAARRFPGSVTPMTSNEYVKKPA
jgi:transcriptional regulator with XRE-family HTH domain